MSVSERISTPPDRSEVAEAELAAYDSIVARTLARGDAGPRSTYATALLHTPVIGAAVRELGRATRLAPTRATTYSHIDFELVVHSLGVKAGFIEHHHILDALAQGVRPEALEALLHGRHDALTDDERQIVDFALCLVSGAMTDERWNAVRALRGERGVIELSIVTGFVWTTLLWQGAWGVAGISADEVEALLDSYRAGTLELPDKQTATRAR